MSAIKDHSAVVFWDGFADGHFTKNLFVLQLRSPLVREFVLKYHLMVIISGCRIVMCIVNGISAKQWSRPSASARLLI